MTCGDFENLIALEVAGDLPAGDAARVQQHLRECASCRTFAEELAADLQWLQSAHREPPDRVALHQVRVGVMRRLESEQRRWDHPFGGLTAAGWRWQWVVTATAVAILLGSFAWWNGSLGQRQTTVAFHSGEQSQRHPGNESQLDRQAESSVAQAEAPAVAGERAGKTVPPPPTAHVRAGDESVPPGSDNERAPRPDRPSESQRETVPAAQLARLDPAAGSPTGSPDRRLERLGSEAQAEVVTAQLKEPPDAPAETVMLKIPTSNPDIVVYWLMDDEKPPQMDDENQGD
jgi:Putative zinc-finger